VPSLIDEKMPCFERSVYREILRNVKARQNAEQIDSIGVTHFSKLLGLRQVSMPNCQTNNYKSIHLAAMVADLHAIRLCGVLTARQGRWDIVLPVGRTSRT
jgi:hypothetical protein